MKRYLILGGTIAMFVFCLIYSEIIKSGVYTGLQLCAQVLIPSLFPLFVLARVLQNTGLSEILAQNLGQWIIRLFGISSSGAEAFVLGLLGGYPLGAYTVADLRIREEISKDEADRLLAFCNNSGPAFIIGAAGGAFESLRAGIFLYVTHVIAAILTGFIFRSKAPQLRTTTSDKVVTKHSRPSFSNAISGAASACISMSAYVCFFSGISALFNNLNFSSPLILALFRGFLELSGGISCLQGIAPTPVSMAIAAWILSWGGISVHLQTLGAVAKTDISCARHLAGRALCGMIAALISFVLWYFC